MQLILPKWYDFHVHLRQEEMLGPLIQAQLNMGCYGSLAMPNTKPPLAKVFKNDDLPYQSLEWYVEEIKNNGGDGFDDFIVPLYLTKDTTAKMIEDGANAGILRACKYYPPHGTTGADFGYPFEEFLKGDVFKAMQAHNVVLCVHGEMHGLHAEKYFDKNSNAEDIFYKECMPRAHELFPDLRIVGEHITTKTAANFVKDVNGPIAATITPQHLLYTVGHLVKGMQYHLYCLPLPKFEDDRQALRDAATSPNNVKFFAGTDSAPHTVKATACGCAAGCFTGGIAPQLYAQGFEEAGVDLGSEQGQDIYTKFLSTNGPDFYNVKRSQETFTLKKQAQKIEKLHIEGDEYVTPLPLGLGEDTILWSIVK